MKAKIYYGLHMVEGVAEYRPAGKTPYRVLLREDVLKQMDATFPGCPVFVKHVDDVDWEKLGTDALIPDGYVVESFFNQPDGKHWTKFAVTTEAGELAIANGETLSNAYIAEESAGGGTWHMVDYAQEIMRGTYEHLAIVKKPRYEESIVLTPEQFKEYNLKKEAELKRLTNSQEQPRGFFEMLFSKKEKVQNSADIESLIVTTDSGKTYSVSELVKAGEKFMNMAGYAADDHMVKLDNEEMSVSDLKQKYNGMCKKNEEDAAKAEEAKKNAEEEEKKKNAEETAKKEEEAKKNAEEEEKKKNAESQEEKDKKQNARDQDDFFSSLGDKAPPSTIQNSVSEYETRSDRVARGKSRY